MTSSVKKGKKIYNEKGFSGFGTRFWFRIVILFERFVFCCVQGYQFPRKPGLLWG